MLVAGGQAAGAQEIRVGIIDFYGARQVAPDQLRQALTFKEGDLVTDDLEMSLKQAEVRLAALAGVVRAHTEMVCCDEGRAIVFIGIEERGTPSLRFFSPPRGGIRLSADVVAAGEAFSQALMQAVQRGDAAEDRVRGHALNHAPEMRAIQEQFIGFARRDLALLRRVLRDSSDAEHRALAAHVLGYADDKKAVVPDLVRATRDPAGEVRNTAMRALLVFTYATPTAQRPTPQVPYEPFVTYLSSPVWSDRNKSSLAVAELSRTRNPQLLAILARTSRPALVEMARWKSKGHAYAALAILGRIAGMSEQAITEAFDRDDRERIISAASQVRP